jgi:putative inorganic carbon (HCO3(-)) transporter
MVRSATHNLVKKLVSIEIWVVAGCVLLSMILPAALPWAVGVGIIYWILRRVSSGQFTLRTPIDISVLLLLILLPLNLWITAMPAITYPQVYRLLSGVILLYAMVNWGRTTRRIRLLVVGTILATLFLALFATVSVEWAQQKLLFIPAAIYDRFTLLVKDTVQHNIMAGSLIILYPITLGLLLFAWKELRSWYRSLLVIVAMVGLLILILTQSRGAILALLAVILILMSLRWKRGWIAILVSMAIGAAAIGYLGIDKSLAMLASGVSLEGLAGRLEVWSRAIYMIQDFPITGVGMGLFGRVTDLVYPFFLNAAGSVPHAHNLILQVAADLGIPGLIAWLSILSLIIVMSFQLYRYGRQRADQWTAGLGAGLLCSQAALIVHGLLDAPTWGGVRPAPIVWAIWGLTSAAWIFSQRRTS